MASHHVLAVQESSAPLSLERNDLSTFFGRYIDFATRTNWKYMFSSQSAIQEARTIVEDAENGNWDSLKNKNVDQQKLFESKTLVDAILHPQTKEEIPIIGRLSAFCPMNIPICAGMLLSTPTVLNCVLWQLINQSYNGVFNRCNANKVASDDKSQSFLDVYGDSLKGYAGAAVVSVGLAVSLTEWLKRGKFSPSTRSKLQAIVPYCAVASAGVSNVVLMRLNELRNGIPIFSPSGDNLGNSQAASKQALFQTAISRAVLPIPILAIPPPLLALSLRIPFVANRPVVKVITQLGILFGCLSIGFPFAVALFPQKSTMPINQLEESFRKKILAMNSESFDYVTFNKGV